MINPQNQRTAKIVELLEQMNLFTADEIALMEDYLTGAAGEEALQKLAFRDLTAIPVDLAAKLRTLGIDLTNKGREAEAERLCLLLFTIGQSTCSGMMPWNGYYNYDKNRILLPEPAMQAAVYAAQIGMNEHMVSRYTIPNLIKLADSRPDTLRKAMEYQKSKTENGKIILLMTYFRIKYPNVRLTEEGADKADKGAASWPAWASCWGWEEIPGRNRRKSAPRIWRSCRSTGKSWQTACTAFTGTRWRNWNWTRL